MSAAENPTRWLEAAAEALPSSIVDGLSIQRSAGPDAATRDRMWERLEARVAQQPVAAVSSIRRQPRLLWCAALLFVITGGIALRAAFHGTGARAALQSPRANRQGSQPFEQRNSSLDAKPAALTPTAPSLPEPTIVPESGPALAPQLFTSPRPSAKLRDRARSSAAPHEPTTSPNDPVAELDLLTRARRVVKADPARALALTVEHSKRYPQGTFMQEREVLAIDALRRLGQDAAASERAARFHRDHPQSVHGARIDDILRVP